MATKLQEKLRCEKEGREFIDTTLSTVGQTPEKQHYVKNADLLAEIMWCKENMKSKDDKGNDIVMATDKLADMFYRIASKLANKLVFPSPEDREDVICTAVVDCIKYFSGFNPEKTNNAFAYVTSICKNGFAKGWRELGYIKLPASLKMSLSDNLYSL